MLDKILAILIVVAAVVGLVLYIRREQQSADCTSGCTGCPIAQKCNKEQKNLLKS